MTLHRTAYRLIDATALHKAEAGGARPQCSYTQSADEQQEYAAWKAEAVSELKDHRKMEAATIAERI